MYAKETLSPVDWLYAAVSVYCVNSTTRNRSARQTTRTPGPAWSRFRLLRSTQKAYAQKPVTIIAWGTSMIRKLSAQSGSPTASSTAGTAAHQDRRLSSNPLRSEEHTSEI